MVGWMLLLCLSTEAACRPHCMLHRAVVASLAPCRRRQRIAPPLTNVGGEERAQHAAAGDGDPQQAKGGAAAGGGVVVRGQRLDVGDDQRLGMKERGQGRGGKVLDQKKWHSTWSLGL